MNKNELLEMLRSQRETYLSESQITKICGAKVNFNISAIKNMLSSLVDEGSVILTDRHKYAVIEKTNIVKGKFIGNIKGFGFVERISELGDDLFIPEKSVNGAVHGDIVLARIVPKVIKHKNYGRGGRNNDYSGRSTEAEIVRILERSTKSLVGTFMVYAGGAIVAPDDKRFADQVFIPMDKTMGAKTNQKVVVEVTAYPSRNQMAMGAVTEILGDVGDIGVDTLSIVRSFGLTEKFPETVLLEAKAVANEPDEHDLKNRKDFTNDLIITIDGDDARDFDDAIGLKLIDGGYELSVHIADVSHYVTQDSEIDKEAFKRATSVYFPDMVLPMLPEELSNNICSLMPDRIRLTLSVVIKFDEKANIKDYQIYKGFIKSHNRMTYKNVTKILNGDVDACKEYAHLVPMLKNMEELANLLIKRRDIAGQLDFNLPEVQIDMDEKNKIKDIYRKPRDMSDRLIEQFMVVTNEVVARHMKNMKLPFVYRIHEVPTQEKMHAFNECVKGLGLNLSITEIDPKPRDVQKIIMAVKGRPMETVINSILLRSMQKAKYSELPVGHFGLALADYCHFTSPIRRYPDLTIHRIIKLSMDGEMVGKTFGFYENFVVESAEQSSRRERLADEAERTVDDLKKAEYMTQFIGKEFSGVVSGISESGIFVQLENTVEGMVTMDDLPKDNYTYDEVKWTMFGKNNTFKLGQKLKVVVSNTDLILRKVYFTLPEDFAKKD